MGDLDGLISALRARFEEPLADRGVRFDLRASRRPVVGGIKQVLLLSVWPADGFDTFEWETSEPNSLEDQVSAVLVRYLNGEVPPFE